MKKKVGLGLLCVALILSVQACGDDDGLKVGLRKAFQIIQDIIDIIIEHGLGEPDVEVVEEVGETFVGVEDSVERLLESVGEEDKVDEVLETYYGRFGEYNP